MTPMSNPSLRALKEHFEACSMRHCGFYPQYLVIAYVVGLAEIFSITTLLPCDRPGYRFRFPPLCPFASAYLPFWAFRDHEDG